LGLETAFFGYVEQDLAIAAGTSRCEDLNYLSNLFRAEALR
jgi:hypothetical protein